MKTILPVRKKTTAPAKASEAPNPNDGQKKGSVRQRGFLLAGKEVRTGEAQQVLSPWNGAVVGVVTVATRADAVSAVDGLERAFAVTRTLPAHERQRILTAIGNDIAAERESFAKLIVSEAGKPIRAARAEVDRSIYTFKAAAEEAVRQGGKVLPMDVMADVSGRTVAKFGIYRRFPIGPIVAITPFNFPLNLVAHKLAPAIAAGCPLLLKPAPQTPLTSLKLGRLVLEAGWPAEALAVMPLANDDTEWLVEHEERFKMLSFTGSAKVGWSLKAKAGKKRVTLELGGNAAMIIHSDWGDVHNAVAKAIVGGFTYAGQSCISVQRIYVERSIFQSFTWKLVEAAEDLVCGNPASEKTVVGPVIRLSDAERIESWTKEAEEQGAKLLTGGERNGAVLEPIVLSGTRPGMKVRDEEVFGPLVTVEAYDDFEAVLAEVNASRYGLQVGLLTRDAGRIFRAFETLDVGALVVGESPTWRLDSMPYGGIKESGFGREGLRYAIEEMTEPKLLVMAL
jgi:acyl-CoA reductase-like NAD-dependent aldehyde dehydrogenase